MAGPVLTLSPRLSQAVCWCTSGPSTGGVCSDSVAPSLAGRVLVHEWAKYRWGVFEEAGYAEDPLYPSFYRRTADQWRPAGCSDAAVAGTVSP